MFFPRPHRAPGLPVALVTTCLTLLAVGWLLAPKPSWAASLPKVDDAPRTGARASADAAVVIGNQDYGDLPDAPFAVTDANAFAGWLLAARGVPSSRVRLLFGVGRNEIRSALRKTEGKVKKGGTAWVFFAGQGSTTKEGVRLLLGDDAEATEAGLATGGVSIDEVVEILLGGRAEHVVLVLDAGFGARGRDGSEMLPGRAAPPWTQKYLADSRVVVWSATRADQSAGAFDSSRHGLFTVLALGALRGWADGSLGGSPDGSVTLAEAQTWVAGAMGLLGRPQVCTLDAGPASRSLVLFQGTSEKAPSPEDLAQIGRDDLLSRLDAQNLRWQAEAAQVWKTVASVAAAGGADGRKALEDFLAHYERPEIEFAWSPSTQVTLEARRMLEAQESGSPTSAASVAKAAPAGSPMGSPTAAASQVKVAPAVSAAGSPTAAKPADDSCQDLARLEPPAMTGTLTAGQISCLEDRFAKEKHATMKDRVSRLLLVDAETRGDRDRWERQVLKHFDTVGRSDPDLCFKYALFLFKKGDSPDKVILWSGYALENKDRWVGQQYEKRVYSLLRLRAEAGTRLWNDAEERYVGSRAQADESKAASARGLAKEYARAWLDYARISGQDAKIAESLCLAAAGAPEYCSAD
jgi:hypothetical protein